MGATFDEHSTTELHPHCVKHLKHSNKLYRYDPCSRRTLWHDDNQFRVSTFRHVLTAEARQSMVEHPLNVRLVLISILRDTPIEVFQFQTILQYIHECYEIIALLALWVLLTYKITKINDNFIHTNSKTYFII